MTLYRVPGDSVAVVISPNRETGVVLLDGSIVHVRPAYQGEDVPRDLAKHDAHEDLPAAALAEHEDFPERSGMDHWSRGHGGADHERWSDVDL